MTDDVIEKVANIINETLDAHIAAHQLADEGLLANTPDRRTKMTDDVIEKIAQIQARADAATETLPDDARMEAYYYTFDRTECGPVDAILSAVAVAGKGAHNTADWNDGPGYYGYYNNRPGLAPEAESPADLIAKTAHQSAEKVRAALADVPALTAALHAVLDRHADDGGGCCRECQFVWPCWTVRDIEEALR